MEGLRHHRDGDAEGLKHKGSSMGLSRWGRDRFKSLGPRAWER